MTKIREIGMAKIREICMVKIRDLYGKNKRLVWEK